MVSGFKNIEKLTYPAERGLDPNSLGISRRQAPACEREKVGNQSTECSLTVGIEIENGARFDPESSRL